jgi:chromosomal replication initiation ATPase DnaA
MAKTHKRKREIVMARQAAFYEMIREGFTTLQIIAFLGSEFQAVVDHSSIVTAVRREAVRRGENYGRNIIREMRAERLDIECVEK